RFPKLLRFLANRSFGKRTMPPPRAQLPNRINTFSWTLPARIGARIASRWIKRSSRSQRFRPLLPKSLSLSSLIFRERSVNRLQKSPRIRSWQKSIVSKGSPPTCCLIRPGRKYAARLDTWKAAQKHSSVGQGQKDSQWPIANSREANSGSQLQILAIHSGDGCSGSGFARTVDRSVPANDGLRLLETEPAGSGSGFSSYFSRASFPKRVHDRLRLGGCDKLHYSFSL